jgi:hypothetical protein
MNMQSVWKMVVVCLCAFFLAAGAMGQEVIPGTPFGRYFTPDQLGRHISFFIADERSATRPLPLVVWIQGTGCSSLFGRNGDRITQGPRGDNGVN